MSAKRENRVLGAHPAAVVADRDQPGAAALDLDCNRPGAGVKRVFDQLLQRGRGPLDDLARRDLARHLLWENMDQPLRHPGPRPPTRLPSDAKRMTKAWNVYSVDPSAARHLISPCIHRQPASHGRSRKMPRPSKARLPPRRSRPARPGV